MAKVRGRSVRRPITFRELFSPSSEKLYFPSTVRRQIRRYPPETRIRKHPRPGVSYSHSDRYPSHNRFLAGHRNEIKVFADVGCAFIHGAPTTMDARRALGRGKEIHAIDNYHLHPEIRETLEREGIRPLTHSIVEEPLPFECDAVRFANVSNHMTQSDRRRSLVNIWKSLREGGFLLGSMSYKEGTETKEHEFVLQKEGRGFKEIVLGI